MGGGHFDLPRIQIVSGSESHHCTVIRFLRVSAKFGTCTVVSVNGTLVEAKMCTVTLESTHFIFNKCPTYTYDGASAKFSIYSHATDYSVHCIQHPPCLVADGLYLPGAALCARPVRRDEGGRPGEAQRHTLTQQEVLPAASQVQLSHPGFGSVFI